MQGIWELEGWGKKCMCGGAESHAAFFIEELIAEREGGRDELKERGQGLAQPAKVGSGEGGEPGSAAEKPRAPSGYAALSLSWCQLAQLWISSAAWGWAWRRRLVTRLRGWGLAERVGWRAG